MRALILALILVLGAGVSLAAEKGRKGEWTPDGISRVGRDNCDRPIVPGGTRNCRAGRVPRDYGRLNPTDLSTITSGSGGGADGN